MGRPRIWIAIVGAGPAGLYAAEELQRRGAVVDVFERRFAPHGAVRAQVAPDHQNIKRRAALPDHVFDPGDARFFGNVEIGRDLGVEELLDRYDAVLLATGSPSPRRLAIPGSGRPGCLSAADFVAWYNAEPGAERLVPPLEGERVVVVGMGHLALDVARILVRHPSELEPTDIAPHALHALRKSEVREVVLLGRRGPDQAAFEDRELLDLCDLLGVRVGVDGLDAGQTEGVSTKRGELVVELPPSSRLERGRRVILRFFTSPSAYLGEGEDGAVRAVRLQRNTLSDSLEGLRATPIPGYEDLEASLVVEALGARPAPPQGVPYDPQWAIVPNDAGQVLTHDGGVPVRGLYVVGSLQERRLRSLEQNRRSAHETAQRIFADLRGRPAGRRGDDVMLDLDRRNVRYVTWWDWKRLDRRELLLGQAAGKVREKFASLTDVLLELNEPRSEVRASPLAAGPSGRLGELGEHDASHAPPFGWGDGTG